jgi:hypothetical protein
VQVGALGIEVDLSNISVATFSFGQESVTLVPPNRLSVAATSMQVVAVMDWRYHDGAIKISGTAKDIMNKTSLDLELEFGSNQGHLTLAVPTCSLEVQEFHIILDGGAGGFYQDIVNLISDPLKSVFEKVIAEVIEDTVQAIASKALPLVPVVLPLGNATELDYALVNASNSHGLNGFHYSDNHFSGSSSPVLVQGGRDCLPLPQLALSCPSLHPHTHTHTHTFVPPVPGFVAHLRQDVR